LGTVTIVDGQGPSTAAVVHRFIDNQGDAWSITNAYLDRYVEEQRLLTTEVAKDSDEPPAYLLRMQWVGRRVAEMQLALASREDIAEFAPEPITAEDTRLWIDALLRRATRVFDDLARREDLPDAPREFVEGMLAQRQALSARIVEFLPKKLDLLKIRHHGDLHLGQMLIAKDDIFIIDFEGEPRRSIGERRRKAPAARDLAGLIRSIEYSAGAALQRALKAAPDADGKIARALDQWRDQSVAAVLAAYHEFLVDPRLWPSDPEMGGRLLDFFLMEKALYEIEYELAHRPDWVRVPLAGFLRILSHWEEALA